MDEVRIARAKAKSVTIEQQLAQLHHEPSLPSDLHKALDVARAAAFGSANLVGDVRRDIKNNGPTIVVDSEELKPMQVVTLDTFIERIRALQEIRKRRELVKAMRGELILASDRDALFGETCAHTAALKMADRVAGAIIVEEREPDEILSKALNKEQKDQFATDQRKLVESEFRLFRERVRSGDLYDLPDARAVVAACEREAHIAASRRGKQESASKVQMAEPQLSASEQPWHSADYSSVRWRGRMYTFSPNQRAVIKLLWEDWEQGGRGLGQAYLLERAGGETKGRLSDLFKHEHAWKTLIVNGARKDVFRLDLPEKR